MKQITTGEGGACLTDDAVLADRIRKLRNHGMTSTADERTGALWKYDVTMLGDNHRMTAIAGRARYLATAPPGTSRRRTERDRRPLRRDPR